MLVGDVESDGVEEVGAVICNEIDNVWEYGKAPEAVTVTPPLYGVELTANPATFT